MRTTLAGLALALASAMLAFHISAASAAEARHPFYEGKTLTIYVGSTAGGVYDLYARLLARHIGRHTPGTPRVVVSNMEGAGSLRLANYLYNGAPKDGTVIGTVNRSVPFEPLIGEREAAKFDASRFTWIGSTSDDISTCVAWKRAGIRDFSELFTRTLTVGGTGAGADTNQFAKALNGVLGTQLQIVSGYPGGNDIGLAMARGEVDGRCGWSWASIRTSGRQWLQEGSIQILVQLGLHKHPDLPGVPLALDFAKTAEQREMLRLVFARNALGYPFVAPPDIPRERAAILKKAFDDTMSDPDFLAEARRSDLQIAPIGGAELEKLVAEVYRTPEDIVIKTRAVVE